MLVVPLTTIAQQFKVECDRLGISALLGSEVNLTADFWSAEMLLYVLPPSPLYVLLNCSYFTQVDPSDLGRELKKRPHILITSVEFLSSTEVQGSMSKFPTVEFLTRWGTRSVIVASHLGTGHLWSTLTSARFFFVVFVVIVKFI